MDISTLTAVQVFVCIFTLAWCITLFKRTGLGGLRYMVGITAVLCVYHTVKLMIIFGLLAGEVGSFEPAEGLMVTTMFLPAIAILEFYIAERKRLQYKLRLTEAAELPPPQPFHVAQPQHAQVLYQAMADACPLAVYATNPSGSVCYWNAAAERLLGWECIEVLGRPIPVHLTRTANDSWLVSKKDGTSLEAQVYTTPFQTPGHEIFGTLTVVAARPYHAPVHLPVAQPAHCPA
jgi:PAS domain S-box-containing protein